MFFRISDLLNLLYPEVCAACNAALFRGEMVVCTQCLYQLPKTNYHLEPGNPIEKVFWGKTRVSSATALYFFNKGERVQHLVHRLKYDGEKEVGELTGRILGGDLLLSPAFSTVKAVVPVPLHASKLRTRGFNQAECIARGISESLSVPIYPDFLVRRKATETQTRKSRYQRFENVDRIFEVNPKYHRSPDHYLLVDDVITTGSTLTACADALLEIPDAKVSIAALAYAR
jgi:ComF family protein